MVSHIRILKSIIGDHAPAPVKKQAVRFHNWYRETRANAIYRRKSVPSVQGNPTVPQHIIFIVIDSLRADVVNDTVSPFINGISGTDAIAPAPWTYPSVASTLTGKYPHRHGACRQNDEKDNATAHEITLPPSLDDTTDTVADYFAATGYETYGAFGFEMPFLAAGGRFHTHRLYQQAPAKELLGDYLDWLAPRREKKTFAYLHLFDLHGPFDATPPQPYWEAHNVDSSISNITSWAYTDTFGTDAAKRYQKHRERLYRAALDYVDDEVAAMSREIDELKIDPVLIITGDHGEAFWEQSEFDAKRFYDSRPAYGVGHGGTPYESIAKVPLYGKNITFEQGPTSLIDIAPTLLNETGIGVPETMDGEVHGKGISPNRTLLIESARYGYEKKAVYQNDFKLLVSHGDHECIGYTLPDETPTTLPPQVENRLREGLPTWPDGGKERRVSSQVEGRLKNLGYK